MRNLIHGGKFNKRSYSENVDEACNSDHGIVVSWGLCIISRIWHGSGCSAQRQWPVLALAACLPGFRRGWPPWRGWADRCRWHSASGAETGKRRMALPRRQCSFRCGDGNGVCNAVCLIFTKQMVGFFQLTGCRGACMRRCPIRGSSCGLIVFSFLSSDTHRTLYGAGGFQDAVSGKSYRACRQT